jgi:uncharacterized protein YgbK (DUF1537 family)
MEGMAADARVEAVAPTRPRALDRPLVVLDDDPTGAQLLASVPVLLEWDRRRIARALAERPSVHLLTNSRALSGARARAVVSAAAQAVAAAVPDAVTVLRGDSTLRGHVLDEYLGLCDAAPAQSAPPLLLVPALPSAGRVTLNGVHLIERDGERMPLDRTEYAADGVFAYISSRLVEWAEERSGGFFRARDGVELGLDELRAARGPERLADALVALAGAPRAAVCVPDAESLEDLEIIAAGLALALENGVRAAVRCAPAFVGVLSGTTADRTVAPPAADRVLVVCGSHVSSTTAQLERLEEDRPGTLVTADLAALASDTGVEIERVAAAARQLLADGVLAVVATPRERVDLSMDEREHVDRNLARVVSLVAPLADVVVAKGGITSAFTLREGLGADEAEVVGPLLPGVSLWRAKGADGRSVEYVVVPGNVGTRDLLADLVTLLLDGPHT